MQPFHHGWLFSKQMGGPMVRLRAHTGLYLCAQNDGMTVCNRATPGPWETFMVVPSGASYNGMATYALVTSHGYFLCNDNPPGNGSPNNDQVMLNGTTRTAVGQWEQFVIVDRSAEAKANSTVWSLQSARNGCFVCAENDRVTVHVNRTSCGEWERFHVEYFFDRPIGLLSAHGRYLCHDKNRVMGSGFLWFGDRTGLGDWETMTAHGPHGPNVYAFKSFHNRWMCAENDRVTVADRDGSGNAGDWEKWHVRQGDTPDKIALRSHHGLFLCAESDNRIVANRAVVGAWESWRLHYRTK